MLYIYYNGQCVGQSEKVVALPSGYTLSDVPPEKSKKPRTEQPNVDGRVKDRVRFSEADVTAIRAKLANLDPLLLDLLELLLRQIRGDMDKTNAMVRKIKRGLNGN